jgi:hypothetical protein
MRCCGPSPGPAIEEAPIHRKGGSPGATRYHQAICRSALEPPVASVDWVDVAQLASRWRTRGAVPTAAR